MPPNSSPNTESSGRLRRQRRAQQLFGRLVGVGDRRQVGFGLDPQIQRAEPVQGQRVGAIGQSPARGRGHSRPRSWQQSYHGPRVVDDELAFVEETHQHGGDVFEAVVDAGGATGSVAVHGVLRVLHAQNCEPGGCGGPDAVA